MAGLFSSPTSSAVVSFSHSATVTGSARRSASPGFHRRGRTRSLATRYYRRRPSLVVSVLALAFGLMRTACASSFSKSVLTK